MGRTKKGLPVDGWVIVDKPAGIGSTQVVGKVRWAFNAQKAGHSGTLDPDATGVLAVALGEATKTIPYVTDALKAYRFRVTLGASTSTDDASGETLESRLERPTDQEIEAALPQFRGQIHQVPPMFSAVKVDGERAYDLAREGVELDLAERPLWVERLEVIGRPDTDHVDLEMVCGKGGYVRSIARDLGAALGCLGHVAWLRRLWTGPFTLDHAVSMEELDTLARKPEIRSILIPLRAGLSDLPEVTATVEGAARIRNGNPGMVIASGIEWGTEVWASLNGEPIAIGRYQGGELHPSRVFRPAEA